MKTALLFIMFSCIFSTDNFGDEGQIVFNPNPWSYILALAKKENKLIFLDAYTSWCGPCKWVSKNIFTNREVADYYNRTFINVSMDMEKSEGREMASKFQIDGYPTFLFINDKEEVIYSSSGITNKKEFYLSFMQFGKDAIEQQKKIKSEQLIQKN